MALLCIYVWQKRGKKMVKNEPKIDQNQTKLNEIVTKTNKKIDLKL